MSKRFALKLSDNDATSERADIDYRIEVAFYILEQEPVGIESNIDIYLDYWIRSRSDDHRQLMEELVKQPELTDERRRRAWHQSERLGLESNFFFGLLPQLVNLEDNQVSYNEALDSCERLLEDTESKDQRYAFGTHAAEAFAKSNSNELKNRLANLMKKVNNDAVVKEILNFGDITEDGLEILKPHFGKSKHWKALQKKQL